MTQPSTLSRAGLRRVLIVLCGTEVTSWGVLYYAFPVLAPTISADTGWPLATVMAAFSASQVTAALTGMFVGRWLDTSGPRLVMTSGSLLAIPALVIIATARSLPQFFVGWIAAGAAMAAVLYLPAFAALTTWWGARRVIALTTLTLVAGLASTIFAPLTAGLAAQFDWRGAYLVLTAALAVVTVPAHLFGLRGEWPRPASPTHAPPALARREAQQVARSREFILLTAATTLAGFAIYAVVVNQVPLLTERGLSTDMAALALGLSGVGQVCGRLGYGRLAAATTVRARTFIVVGAGAATTALLAAIPGPTALLVVAAVLAGAARGLFTLLQATAVTDRWGPTHYGRLNGLMSAPVLLAVAVSPWVGAALAQGLGSYPPVFAVLAATAATGAVLAALPFSPDRPSRSAPRSSLT